MQNKINVFLDDFRSPEDSYKYTKNPIYLKKKWEVVRNHDEFVGLLTQIMVDGDTIGSISFDHDLADDHYAPQDRYNDYELWLEQHCSIEKTGLDCAKYFTNYMDRHNMPIPGMTVHSQNPVGKKRIEEHLMDWMDSLTYPEGPELDESELSAN